LDIPIISAVDAGGICESVRLTEKMCCDIMKIDYNSGKKALEKLKLNEQFSGNHPEKNQFLWIPKERK
jgi:hypothetical protein